MDASGKTGPLCATSRRCQSSNRFVTRCAELASASTLAGPKRAVASTVRCRSGLPDRVPVSFPNESAPLRNQRRPYPLRVALPDEAKHPFVRPVHSATRSTPSSSCPSAAGNWWVPQVTTSRCASEQGRARVLTAPPPPRGESRTLAQYPESETKTQIIPGTQYALPCPTISM
jgi:hypothetical protein